MEEEPVADGCAGVVVEGVGGVEDLQGGHGGEGLRCGAFDVGFEGVGVAAVGGPVGGECGEHGVAVASAEEVFEAVLVECGAGEPDEFCGACGRVLGGSSHASTLGPGGCGGLEQNGPRLTSNT